jgi:hypothetical protein
MIIIKTHTRHKDIKFQGKKWHSIEQPRTEREWRDIESKQLGRVASLEDTSARE